jgi:hypothetical protein
MSTVNEREMLRRALQLADGIEPRADGLQRIHAKLRPPRPLAVAWADGAWTYLRMRVPAAFEAFVEVLRNLAGLAWERFGPSRGASAGRASRTLGWLRPAAALGVTVFIVAAGTYFAINTQQGISPSASNAVRSGSGTGAGGGQGSGSGASAQGRSTLGSGSSARPTTSPTCLPSKSSTAAPAASGQTGQIQGTSPSASPTDTSSGASPSPSVPDSSTPTPGASNTGQTGMSTNGTDIPAVGSSSAAVATLTSRSVLARSSAKPSSLPTCSKKHPVSHNSPGPTPAVFSYGRLDGGR